jgi:hypothetical protein
MVATRVAASARRNNRIATKGGFVRTNRGLGGRSRGEGGYICLKDVSIFNLTIVPQRWGRLAIGPVISFSQSDSDAESKFAISPAIGAVKPLSKRLLVGAFSQNLFAAHVGISQIQPVIAYQPGHGWALSAGDTQFTYDWERDEWTNVPLGFQIGVVRIVAKQPFRFYVNPQWNFKDITGAVKSKVVCGVTLLAPAG